MGTGRLPKHAACEKKRRSSSKKSEIQLENIRRPNSALNAPKFRHWGPDRACPILERFDCFREPCSELPNPPLTDNPHVPGSHMWNPGQRPCHEAYSFPGIREA